MDKVIDFLKTQLDLGISDEKTSIRHGKKGINFLNYQINAYTSDKLKRVRYGRRVATQRTVVSRIHLRVPVEKVIQFCNRYKYGDWYNNKPLHRAGLAKNSTSEIIVTVNAELMGLANYYAYANDVKSKLNKLFYLAHYSLFKTLALKYKTPLTSVLRKFRQGYEFAYEYNVGNQTRTLQVYQLKHLQKPDKNWEIDSLPQTFHLTSTRSELVRRMNANKCEYCGIIDTEIEVHHVRKLKDLKEKPNVGNWEKLMIARHRKTMILCCECHQLLHAGRLPDNRFKPMTPKEQNLID